MNSAQVTACQPGICVKNTSQLHQLDTKPCILPMNTNRCSRIVMKLREKPSFGFKCLPILKSRKPLRICLAGGEGTMGDSGENSPWKSIENAMEKFKGQSIEDVLRQQIQKGEYFDNGSSGAKPPVGGGGGGGGDGDSPDGTDGPEEESFGEMLDENLQMILALLGFIFLYIYILTGEELTKLARDYIKYLFGGSQSVRLKTAMWKWGLMYRSMTAKRKVDDFWLERAIMNTPTWWYDPDDLREALLNSYVYGSDSDDDEDEDEDE